MIRRPGRVRLRADLDRVYGYFPRLRERRQAGAGQLSGGEQQMVAIGRAVLSRPRLLLLDEPSMGLAPRVVQEIFAIIDTLNREEGVSVLVAEQNATVALRTAHHGYVLENGRVVAHGPAAALAARSDVRSFYLGNRTGSGPRRPRRSRDRRSFQWTDCLVLWTMLRPWRSSPSPMPARSP